MAEILKKTPASLEPEFVDLNTITDYSTFFAEWMVRENDVIVHLFPRAGGDDKWSDGFYVNRCKKCDREVRDTTKPCECGHKGLRYIPGRREEKSGAKFPAKMKEVIAGALDHCWMGTAAVESTREVFERTNGELAAPIDNDLGAWVVQFQNAWTGNEVQTISMLEKFFDGIDTGIEG